jgi:hypothetical protein
MWNLPHGVLKFALNASIDTLPTFTNLKRWGKRACVNCHLCGNTVKKFHVLVHCNHTMDQGRMTWKHDSVLKHIAGCLKSALESLSTVEVQGKAIEFLIPRRNHNNGLRRNEMPCVIRL